MADPSGSTTGDAATTSTGPAADSSETGAPKLDVAAYMQHEARFRMVELRSPDRYVELVAAAREAVRQRWSLYDQLAKVHTPAVGGDHG